MPTADKPSYPTVVIEPGAGGSGGGAGGMSEAAVKALIALRRAARSVSADFTVGANDGIVNVSASTETTGSLTAIATLGVGRAFLVNNRGSAAAYLVPADESDVCNHEGAPGSPPGYTVAPGSSVLITAVSASAWQVAYDSSLLGGNGGDGSTGVVASAFVAAATDLPDAASVVSYLDGLAADIPAAQAGPGTGTTMLVLYGEYTTSTGFVAYTGVMKAERTNVDFTGGEHDPYWSIIVENALTIEGIGGTVIGAISLENPARSPIAFTVSLDVLSGIPVPVATSSLLNDRQAADVADLIGGSDNPVAAALAAVIDAALAANQVISPRPLIVRTEWIIDYQGDDLPIDGSKNPYPPVPGVSYTRSRLPHMTTNTTGDATALVFNVEHDGEERNGFWLWNGDNNAMTRPTADAVIGTDLSGAPITLADLPGRPVLIMAESGTHARQWFLLNVPASSPTVYTDYKPVSLAGNVGVDVLMEDSGPIPLHAATVSLRNVDGQREVTFQAGHRIPTTVSAILASNTFTVKDWTGRALRSIQSTSLPITFRPTGVPDNADSQVWVIDDPNADPDDLHARVEYWGNTPVLVLADYLELVDSTFDGQGKLGDADGLTLAFPGSDHSSQLCTAAAFLAFGGNRGTPTGITRWTGKQIVGVEVDIGSVTGGDMTAFVTAEYSPNGNGGWGPIDGSAIDTVTMTPVAFSNTELPGYGTKAAATVTENTRITLAFDTPGNAEEMRFYRLIIAAYPTPGGTIGDPASIQLLRVKPIVVDYAAVRAAQTFA